MKFIFFERIARNWAATDDHATANSCLHPKYKEGCFALHTNGIPALPEPSRKNQSWVFVRLVRDALSKLLMDKTGSTASMTWLKTSCCFELNLSIDLSSNQQNYSGICSWGKVVRDGRFNCAEGHLYSESVEEDMVMRILWISART